MPAGIDLTLRVLLFYPGVLALIFAGYRWRPQLKPANIFSGALPFVFMVFITMVPLCIFLELAPWLPSVL